MKRYTWDELYKRADDKPCGSAELRAKDEARYQIRCRIMDSAMHDIEEDECPEESIDNWLKAGYETSGKHLMFDDAGNIQPMPKEKDLEDIFIYVPGRTQIIRIAEGTGDNLVEEDIEAGYEDYIYYEQYAVEQGMSEVDGGQILLNTLIWEKYDSLLDAIEDVLNMAYGASMPHIVLIDESNSEKTRTPFE